MIPKPHLPPSPIGEGKVTVTAIETLQPVDLFPGLLLVRIHTDAGLIGHGKTYNVPVSMHDCTGPLTLFAGLHMGAARWPIAATRRRCRRRSKPSIGS